MLDLCCGTGRHAIPLQRRGMRVTGVDSSRKLLAKAAERADRVGAYPSWVLGDARSVPLKAGAFDAAICLFNSIGYGTDAEALAMLREARRCSRQLLLETVHRDEHVRNAGPGGPMGPGGISSSRLSIVSCLTNSASRWTRCGATSSRRGWTSTI